MIFIGIVFFQYPGKVKRVYGYYGVPNIFSYNRLNSPFTYSGPLGTPLNNLISNPFSFGGLYNLTSSFSGLYMLGLLNGFNRLGGLYGQNAVYGLYGLSGLYGLNGFNLFGLGLPGLTTAGSLNSIGMNAPLFLAEQAGAWTGTWNLGFLTGTMIMNLQETITGSISGTAQLIGNLTFGGIFNVYGSASTTFVSLNGQDPTLTYAVTLQGTLTTPGTMEGFYSIYKIGSTTPKETGTFNLELLI